MNPFGGGNSFDAVVLGLLTGVFIYWGWESTVNLNEETEDSDSTPGKAALVSTVLLLLTYLLATYAVIAYLGADGVTRVRGRHGHPGHRGRGRAGLAAGQHRDAGHHHVGHRLGPDHDPARVAHGAVDGAPGRLPAVVRGASTRGSRRPTWPPSLVGGVALVWYVFFNLISQNFLFDSLTALAIVIAFYYSLTGFACAIYHRRELTKSAKNFFFMGVAPVTGALILGGLFVKAVWEYRKVDDSYSGPGHLRRRHPGGAGRGPDPGRHRADAGLARSPATTSTSGASARWSTPKWRRAASTAWPRCRRGQRLMPAIVVGYDDSPGLAGGARGGGVAGRRARRRPGHRLRHRSRPGSVGEEFKAHRDALRDSGEQAAKHAVELVRDKGVETRVELVDERPVDALLALAEQHDARFIVVGTYGESPLKGAILGSTPHKLLHLSETPVVVVPA